MTLIKSILISFISIIALLETSSAQERFFYIEDEVNREIEYREFSDESLDIYRNDEDFNYSENGKSESRISKIWKNFWRKLMNSLDKGFNSKIVMYVLAGVAVVALIWFLLSTQSSTFIAKKNHVKNRYVEELDIRVDENILRQKLEEAEASQSYKKAIRYAYLLNLKALNEKDKIIWKEYKLSSDYLSELKDKSLKADFKSMTKYFNYAWYGKRNISTDNYLKVKDTFKNLITKIDKK